MKRYKVVKIVYAEDLIAATAAEKKIAPVEVSLDEEVGDPDFKDKVIGFHNAEDGRK